MPNGSGSADHALPSRRTDEFQRSPGFTRFLKAVSETVVSTGSPHASMTMSWSYRPALVCSSRTHCKKARC